MSCNFVFNETRDTVGRVAEKCTQGVRDNSAGGGLFSISILIWICEVFMLVNLGRILKVKILILSLKISLEQMLRKQPVNESVL